MARKVRKPGACLECGKRTARVVRENGGWIHLHSACDEPYTDYRVRQGDIPDEDGVWHSTTDD